MDGTNETIDTSGVNMAGHARAAAAAVTLIVGDAPTRDTYTRVADALGVASYPDAFCHQMATSPATYDDDTPWWVAMTLAGRRGAAVMAERAAAYRALTEREATAPLATRPCAVCGAATRPALLMTSARGAVCGDCYDDANN